MPPLPDLRATDLQRDPRIEKSIDGALRAAWALLNQAAALLARQRPSLMPRTDWMKRVTAN